MMSTDELTRREMLKKISLYMGGAISAPTVAAILAGCGEQHATPVGHVALSWSPTLFSTAQATLVGEMAETIIPRTDTPGARDAGVPSLIDSIVARAFMPEQRQQYLSGLDKFDASIRKDYGKPFSDLDNAAKLAVITRINGAVLNKNDSPFSDEEKNFYRTTKELTLLAFFRSEAGATQVLQYIAVPGEYRGCVPLKEIGKAWATT